MMKKILLTVSVALSVCAFGFLAFHCGGESAGPECKTDVDCPEGQACIDGVCVGAEVCDPPCDPEVEICYDGECVPVGDPADKDGDGYLTSEDCDDFDWTVNPGATEYCDGMDNNCDTKVDEGCYPCADGDTQPCGTDVGECIAGVQTCQDGRWGFCEGSVGPEAERCDRKDNDCDGLVDEVCPCTEGATVPCGTDEGECAQGTQVCEEGAWGGCRNGETPKPEICDGLDNDCDGTSDDGFMIGTACQGAGECGDGAIECATESSSGCSTDPGGSQDQSQDEVCDGRDNDCDGETDEGFDLGQACAGRGSCGAGTWECTQDGGRICSTWPGGSQDQSQDEACDGADNDCDGETDEDYHVGEACDGTGSCGAGQTECASGSSTRCSTDPGGTQDQSRAERCDGLDDDCDGETDEDFMVAGELCGGCGICSPATGLCQADNGICTGNCSYCRQLSDINFACAPVEDGCGNCGACTGSGNSFNCQADGAMCTGNCDVCSGSGTAFNCAADDSACTGNCDVCAGSGTAFNCAADNSACTGNCDVCSGSGTAFNCAADDGLCTGNCDACAGSGTEFNCAADESTCTGNCDACTGSGTEFNCAADDGLCTGNCDYCSQVSAVNYACAPIEDACGNCGACTGSGTAFSCAADDELCTGNCDVCAGSGTEFNCAANDSDCTGDCAECSGSGTEFSCAADQSACTGDCGICQGTGTAFNCAGDDGYCGTCEDCSLQGTSHNCTEISTTWGDNLYDCMGSNKRCDVGSCVTCGGYVYDDGCGGCAGQGGKACWYEGDDMETCTTVCSSHGGCIEANWNDDSNCSVQRHFTTCDLGCEGSSEENSPIPAHIITEPPYSPTGDRCVYRTGGSQSCGATSPPWPVEGAYFYRLCVCDH